MSLLNEIGYLFRYPVATQTRPNREPPKNPGRFRVRAGSAVGDRRIGRLALAIDRSRGSWRVRGRNLEARRNAIVFRYYLTGWDHNELRIVSADGIGMRTLWVSPQLGSAETPDWST